MEWSLAIKHFFFHKKTFFSLLLFSLWLNIPTLQAKPFISDSLSSLGVLKNFFPSYFADEKFLRHMDHFNQLSILIYFRTEFHWNLDKQTITKRHKVGTGDFFLQPIMIDIKGPIIAQKLSFRFRMRTFSSFNRDDLKEYNRINYSLDYAYLNWDIAPRWGMMAGKNIRFNRGFEKEIANPVSVYHSNHFFNAIENPAPLGLYLHYKFNPQHNILFGLYQVNNKTLSNLEKSMGFRVCYQPRQKESSVPIGVGMYWNGDFLKGKWHMKWSIYAEHPLTREANFTLVMGQKLHQGPLEIWADITLAYMATDMTTLTTPFISRVQYPVLYKANYTSGAGGEYGGLKPGAIPLFFSRNVLYSVLSLRLDYHIGKHFVFVFTGQYEHADKLKDPMHIIGNGFRKILYTNFTLEYYPFPTHRFAFFIFTDQDNTYYNQPLQKTGLPAIFTHNKLGVGVFYPLSIF